MPQSSKIRIYDLKKELNVDSKIIFDVLNKEFGMEVHNAAIGLDADKVERVRNVLAKPEAPNKPTAAPKPAPQNVERRQNNQQRNGQPYKRHAPNQGQNQGQTPNQTQNQGQTPNQTPNQGQGQNQGQQSNQGQAPNQGQSSNYQGQRNNYRQPRRDEQQRRDEQGQPRRDEQGQRRDNQRGQYNKANQGQQRPKPQTSVSVSVPGRETQTFDGGRVLRPAGMKPVLRKEEPPKPVVEPPKPSSTFEGGRITRPVGMKPVLRRDDTQPERQSKPPYTPRTPYQGNKPPYQGNKPPYQGNKPPGAQKEGGQSPYKPSVGANGPQVSVYRPGGGGGYRPKTAVGGHSTGYGDKDADTRPRNASAPPPRKGDKGKLTVQEKPQKQAQKLQAAKQHDKKGFKTEEHEEVKNIVRKGKNVEKNVKREVEEPKFIAIPAVLTLKELAEVMNKSGAEVVKAMMRRGQMVNVNHEIDYETASSIAEEFNILCEEQVEADIFEEAFAEQPDREEELRARPPVVVVMGHVDHGKTSLLDAIRKSRVAAGEAGGITQHIGAYIVDIDNKPITFLDTPGHEAFTAMRMRGAQVTDIAVLVVAADDGVMPQTVEAINHAKAANVEIIVAINKIDKPGANPDRVKRELLEHELVAEEYGGQTICVPVSAHTGEGLATLLEMVILVAEMKNLRANPHSDGRGTIIEASLDKGQGTVATILVQKGTVKVGDPIVTGSMYGKVRAMIDDKGRKVKKATPGQPVVVLGLSDVPQAGDMFYIAKNEKQARQVAESHFAKGRLEMLKATPQKVSLDDLFTQIKAGNIKDLNIVIKADVQGSVEAVRSSLEKLSNDEVRIRTIHGGVGAITESDVTLASASMAIIIGFNVRPEPAAKQTATEQQVDIRLYRVIYNAIEDIEAAMKGMLDPVFKEKVLGHAEIRKTFRASGVGTIGGAYVTDGKVTRGAKVRIVRDGIVVHEGELETLKRFKDDVREVAAGYECGVLVARFNDIKENDVVEAFVMEQIER